MNKMWGMFFLVLILSTALVIEKHESQAQMYGGRIPPMGKSRADTSTTADSLTLGVNEHLADSVDYYKRFGVTIDPYADYSSVLQVYKDSTLVHEVRLWPAGAMYVEFSCDSLRLLKAQKGDSSRIWVEW